MLILRPTLDLAKALKLAELEDAPPSAQPLTDWCVRGFRVRRTTYLMFTESLSLYSLVMPRRGITTAAKLRRAFATLVHEEFKHPTLGNAPATEILRMMTQSQFARCRNRRVLGSINDLTWGAQCHLDSGDSIPATITLINQAPMGHLQMDSPTDKLAELLIKNDARPRVSGQTHE